MRFFGQVASSVNLIILAGVCSSGFHAASWAQSQSDLNDLLGKTSAIDTQSKAFRESWLRQCLEIQTLDRDDLIAQLAAKNIVVRDPKSEISMDMLQYVLKFLQLIDYQKPEQLVLIPWASEGAQRIRMSTQGAERVLQISTQAAQDTFATRLREALLVEQRAGRPTRGTQLDIRFTNSLFEQMVLAVATPEVLEQLIAKHFGISTQPSLADTRPMTLKELTFVLKQLVDLPQEVLDVARPVLNRIVRSQGSPGYRGEFLKLGSEPLAYYEPSEKSIRLFDKVFPLGQANSNFNESGHYSGVDEVLIHEMGHGVWFGLPPEQQREFTNISWTRRGYFEFDLKLSNTEFLSEYSQKNPLEDFAVHFAAYVQTPGKLLAIAPIKYQFFKKVLFRGVEFGRTANEKHRVLCDACEPDIQPPTLAGNLVDLLTLHTSILEKNPGNASFSCALKGVFDDLSGVAGVYVEFEEEIPKHPGFPTRQGFNLKFDSVTGQWVDQEKINGRGYDRGQFYPGNYLLSYIALEDYALNRREVKPASPIRLDFHGTREVDTTQAPATLGVDPREITVRHLTDAEREAYPVEGEIVEFSIPYPHRESGTASLGLTLPQTTHELNVHAYNQHNPDYAKDIDYKDPKVFVETTLLGAKVKLRGQWLKWFADYHSAKESYASTFVSKPGDSKTVFRVLFGPQFKPQTVRISSVTAMVGKDSKSTVEVRQAFADELPNLRFSIRPAQSVKYPKVEILANELGVESHPDLVDLSYGDKAGTQAETTGLVVSVPVQILGLDREGIEKDFRVSIEYVLLRGPKGDHLSAYPVGGRNFFLANEVDSSGRAVMRFEVTLPPNHAKGDYLVEDVAAAVKSARIIQTRDPRTRARGKRPGLNVAEAPGFSTTFRFSDREIKKKIEIR